MPSDANALTTSFTPRSKRRRLNFACNYCRSRKTRCDEQRPSCHACQVAQVPCVTEDRRRPGSLVERREATKRTSNLPNAVTINDPTPGPDLSQHQEEINASSRALETTARHESSQFQGRLPLLRQQPIRTVIEALTSWLELAIYRLGKQKRTSFSPKSSPSLLRGLTFHLPEAPQLPNSQTCDALFNRYFQTVNTVYPFLEEGKARQTIWFMQSHGPEGVAERYGLPSLLQIYLVIILGAFSATDLQPSKDLIDAETYCKTLYGHVLCSGDFEAVRGAALFALLLKFRGRDTAAWANLTQSISLAVSLGLEGSKRAKKLEPLLHRLSVEERVWWSLRCFEALFAFELGRRSRSSDMQGPPAIGGNVLSYMGKATSEEERNFIVMASLAETLGTIGDRCIRATVREEESSSESEALQAAICAKVQTTGECCLMLTEWIESIPMEYRPASEIPYGERVYPFRAFISMQYHNALVMLCRNSLLISEEAVWLAAEIVAKDQPWQQIIRNGQAITANTARKILVATVESHDLELEAALPTFHITLHACFVLYIYTVRHPKSRMVTTDQTLILNVIDQLMDATNCWRVDLNPILQKLKLLMDANYTSLTTEGDDTAEDRPTTSQALNEAASESLSHHSAQSGILVGPAPTDQSQETFDGENDRIWSEVHANLFNAFDIDDMGYSPSLPDLIGWDWAAFSQLPSMPPSPRMN
ncbi:hypothetical protein BU24DRAFT_467832 [Aaosphaeria arxii CBS 175.79]|uniref:Zn(2)-C6 fungal-type domain-containing protein n=1 Tax=Aaosphaeria arxii CBS 175.79 TaxID=1450172 RepID=A0A6A5X9N0_9PLEO|nr:uncharacterized protein BU24DRAFT_467832 [Aaosphaeria arxii CBS 175.79]KAF2009454.1 hypothetical protein BU24DRAFT_467832 [Aaosphaeria arxii CBS 175.79]